MFKVSNDKFLQELKIIMEKQIFKSNDNRYPCIVFDIDGTLINPHTNEIIKSVVDFFHHCKQTGIKIIIVTARPGTEHNIKHTIGLLENLGIYNRYYKFMRPDLYYQNRQREYKENARKEILKDHEIIMSLGDMPFDIDTYCNVGVLVRSTEKDMIEYNIEYH